MFPNRPEWHTWSSLEKATYIAQLVAALSILPTVVFAWLGWREAHNARLEQTRFFIAEKAPDIEVAEVKIVPNPPFTQGLVTFTLRNTGGSSATKVKIALEEIGAEKLLLDTAKKGQIFERLSIAKGKTAILPVLRVEDIETAIGWKPQSLRVYQFGDKMEKGEFVVAILLVRYEGEFEDQHDRNFLIAMRKQSPNPTVERGARKKSARPSP